VVEFDTGIIVSTQTRLRIFSSQLELIGEKFVPGAFKKIKVQDNTILAQVHFFENNEEYKVEIPEDDGFIDSLLWINEEGKLLSYRHSHGGIRAYSFFKKALVIADGLQRVILNE
jgi:hypothetical protein